MKDFQESIDKYKVWFVSIFWRPNVGKSTFLNTLLWQKVSIVSSVPQTTRKKILWIYNDEDSQIVFFDTPWIHNSEKAFNIAINWESFSTFNDADVVCYFVDPTRQKWEEEANLEKVYNTLHKPKIKVFTKGDLKEIFPISQESEGIQISSQTKWGFSELLEKIKSYLPTWPLLYPQDFYTYQPMSQRVEEIVREKIFLYAMDEIPHSTFVQVDDIHDEWKMLKILCYIYTETESQKTIIVGKKWAFLSKIGKQSREELEAIFWRKIFLSLRVKVYPKWRQDDRLLKNMFEK